ncbi:hypothetical protein [Haematobacter sp.]|nr:hypothetical protein [Haematobacter sp.]
MTVADFHIGMEFLCGDRRWRCTDVGTRVIAAIRVDQVAPMRSSGKPMPVLAQKEAEAEGWFNGPPYAVAEIVFDEEDMKACEPAGSQASSSSPGMARRRDSAEETGRHERMTEHEIDEGVADTTGEVFGGFQHEAGDRAYVAHQHFVDFVQRHPFIEQRPDLAALAYRVDEAMADLYQAIWKVEE